MFTNTRCCLLHTASLIVHYEPARKCLYTQWRGCQHEWQIREHTLFIQSCLRAHACQYILSDHFAMRSSWTGMTSWVARQLAGQYDALGVRALAWVSSAYEPLDRKAMEMVSQLVRRPKIAVFADAAQADAWLRFQ